MSPQQNVQCWQISWSWDHANKTIPSSPFVPKTLIWEPGNIHGCFLKEKTSSDAIYHHATKHFFLMFNNFTRWLTSPKWTGASSDIHGPATSHPCHFPHRTSVSSSFASCAAATAMYTYVHVCIHYVLWQGRRCSCLLAVQTNLREICWNTCLMCASSSLHYPWTF
jgi:hypothetical protein